MSLEGTKAWNLTTSYRPIKDGERPEYYAPGGFHPVSIGEQLQSRYVIIHKLGYGAVSTTWLARDSQTNVLVAIKIARADTSSSREIGFYPRLHEAVKAFGLVVKDAPLNLTSWNVPILPLLDQFTVQGPHGSHQCYVTLPAGMTVARAKELSPGGTFELPVARAFAAQLTCAVAFMHSCGIVHADLHLGNVLIKPPDKLEALSDEQLHRDYEAPKHVPVTRLDGKRLRPGVPSHIVSPIRLGRLDGNVSLSEASIFLIDFGEAFLPLEEPRFESHTEIVVRPPEAWFEPTKTLSFASDIWTLACSIWEMLGWATPFDNCSGSHDDTTYEQIEALGPLPVEWWDMWEHRGANGTDNGVVKDGGASSDLEDRFETRIQDCRRAKKMEAFSRQEKAAILSLMRSMLSFRPEQRPSATQVLESEWMQQWTLPEYRKMLAQNECWSAAGD